LPERTWQESKDSEAELFNMVLHLILLHLHRKAIIMKLSLRFYTRNDVVLIARELLGKVLVTRFDGKLTSGIITETEAYAGVTDRASHAYNGRRTERTEIMYWQGGTAYIYLCYGVHSLFNVVTNKNGVPHAVLIRALKALDGKDIMMQRLSVHSMKDNALTGPGKLSKALGIHFSDTGTDLAGDTLWIEDRKIKVRNADIIAGPRIGIDYAGEDAKLPFRFVWNKGE
jgi:DNA-3-methyladenine glycosylase